MFGFGFGFKTEDSKNSLPLRAVSYGRLSVQSNSNQPEILNKVDKNFSYKDNTIRQMF